MSKKKRIILDLCCLKRLFDNQKEGRVHIEAVAVRIMLARHEEGSITLVSTPSLLVENERDPNPYRRIRVRRQLQSFENLKVERNAVEIRADSLRRMGFGQFDALHLAWAEIGGVDTLLTVDDAMKRLAQRTMVKLEVLNPVFYVFKESQEDETSL